jgi:hypothetical protein
LINLTVFNNHFIIIFIAIIRYRLKCSWR